MPRSRRVTPDGHLQRPARVRAGLTCTRQGPAAAYLTFDRHFEPRHGRPGSWAKPVRSAARPAGPAAGQNGAALSSKFLSLTAFAIAASVINDFQIVAVLPKGGIDSSKKSSRIANGSIWRTSAIENGEAAVLLASRIPFLPVPEPTIYILMSGRRVSIRKTGCHRRVQSQPVHVRIGR
jgi:hypothetical protein